MKEYIKLFTSPGNANMYSINDIPFTSTVQTTTPGGVIENTNLLCNTPDRHIKLVGNTPSVVDSTVTITGGTWNPSVTDRLTKVVVSGEVVLNGKTDCYSIEFTGNGHLTINAGARLRVWEGGITNNDAESTNYLTIWEDKVNELYGEFLLHPNVSVNNHPMASVKVISAAKQINQNTYSWSRMAIPMLDGNYTKFSNEGLENIEWYNDVVLGEGLYQWSAADDEWKPVSRFRSLMPFNGYQYTNTSKNGGVICIYTGKIVGNTNFNIPSYANPQIIGNSYTYCVKSGKLLELLLHAYSNGKLYLADSSEVTSISDIRKINTLTYITLITNNNFILSYKDLVWDPSFEEEATPTRSIKTSNVEHIETDDKTNQIYEICNVFENNQIIQPIK